MRRQIAEGVANVVTVTADVFKISRQAAHKHLRTLIADGSVRASGATRNRRYELATLTDIQIDFALDPGLEEHVVFQEHLLPHLGHLNRQARTICEYAFTEMFNNAIDHSEGTRIVVRLRTTPALVFLRIDDDGVGIFRKIRDALGLEHERQAILELTKGKFTTDPNRHSGEGIFFTSRAVDHFGVASGQLYFSHWIADDGDWLIEGDDDVGQGTSVAMEVSASSNRSLQDIFDEFTASKDEVGFSKTHIPVNLLEFGGESLVSRSQAKRLVARIDRFKEVVLDFEGVSEIGQAFADEVFRVFQRAHPDVHLFVMNASDKVNRMIARARQ